MVLYTFGFTQKSAEQFFETIKSNGIELLVDVRLNNRSQLAGFTKGSDLEYFLKEICRTRYIHCDEFAPTKDLLGRYQKGITSWEEYETEFCEIMERRGVYKKFISRFGDFNRICLLCSEPTPDQCHRRLVAEKIKGTDEKNVVIIHL